jgi:putative transposase
MDGTRCDDLLPVDERLAHQYVGCGQTVRSECLDWMLILGRRHLDRVLQTYAAHYNGHRPHRALELAAPLDGVDQPRSHPRAVHRREVLGGLIHEYEGVAA